MRTTDVVDHLFEAVDGGEGQGQRGGALGVLEMDGCTVVVA